MLKKVKHSRPYARMGLRASAIKASAIKVVLLGCICLMAACSRSEFFYGNADWLLAQYLGTFVSLDGRQKELLASELERLHIWHRQTQLA
ncbi:MAG: hypothetical protein GKR94_21725 [Gammaproteobacteria bacterium]|nr:hypothetical protein [Gammaproteobacteria bacterium]